MGKKIVALICSGAFAFSLANPLYATEQMADHSLDGAEIYHDFCSVCHGERGDGNSRASGGLKPPPRNFTVDKAREVLTRDRMIFSATYGRPNTAMVGWSSRLSEKQIEVVVDYVRTTFMGIETSHALSQSTSEEQIAGSESVATSEEYAGVFDPEFMSEPMPYELQGVEDWGKIFYNDTCAKCHGENGDGKGPRSKFIMPKPRDFRHPASRNKFNRPKLFEIINSGSHGSEMPAWDKVLTYQEIGHVTEYIFNRFIKDEKHNSAMSNGHHHNH